jgi:hypothetical protein
MDSTLVGLCEANHLGAVPAALALSSGAGGRGRYFGALWSVAIRVRTSSARRLSGKSFRTRR